MKDDVQEREVRWYRRHGRFAARIRYTPMGREYVVGDHSWNMRHPEHTEYVEKVMQVAGVYRAEVEGAK